MGFMMTQLLSRKNRVSLEIIDFQNNEDGFTEKFESILTDIQNKFLSNKYEDNKALQNSDELANLKLLIQHRFNMKVKIVTNKVLAAVLPFYSNKNHIFLHEFFRGHLSLPDQDKLLKNSVNKKGFVNIHNATLGGFFSEYEVSIYMNFKDLFTEFKASPKQVAAILLHEIGHNFHACEYSDRLETNNQILANVSERVLNGYNSEKDIDYIYKELKTLDNKLAKEDVEDLVKGHRIVVGVKWFKTVIGIVRSQMTDSTYSKTSFEQLADSFAARFGYGRELVKALEVLNDYYDPFRNSIFFSLLSNSVSLILLLSPIVYLTGGYVLAAILYSLLAYFLLRISSEDLRDYTYDDLKLRYKRIRNEYVEFLKISELDHQQMKDILDSVYQVDAILERTKNYEGLMRTIGNFIFSDARNAKKNINEQQMLEELAFNDLFVKSAELKTIAPNSSLPKSDII